MRRLRFVVPIGLACWFPAPPTYAGPDDSDAVQAFRQGLQRMQAGECLATPPGDRGLCEQAREDFDRAYRLRPSGLGALRNRAFIERSLGWFATAARSFAELEAKARNDPDEKRRGWAEFAHAETRRLDPSIPRLTIALDPDARDSRIVVGGHVLTEPELGRPLKLDPGTHRLAVYRPGKAPQVIEVTLAAASRRTLTVGATPTEPAPAMEPPDRTLPLVVTLVGVGVTALGLGLGAAAWEGKGRACDTDDVCDEDRLDSARGYARASTGVTIAGAAITAGGLIWYLVTPRARAETVQITPWLGPHGGGGVARARF